VSKLPEPQQPDAALSAARAEQAAAASSLDEAPNTQEADRTLVGTVLEVEREFIWIETEGARAKLYASELMLDIGEVPADRYAPGDRFEAFVFQMKPEPTSGAPQFSIRRAAPYLDALNRLKVGSVVASATVVNTYDVGIELDVDGVRGNAFSSELPLHPGESTHQRYQPGDITSDLLVYEIDNDDRGLFLSVRRNAPGYVETLNAHSVGDVVSATVTVLTSDGGLLLDVGDVLGGVLPDELSLLDGGFAQDHYAVGDIVRDLFVRHVNRDARILSLSVRRNTPSYVKAFNAHSVGDVVSATVTGFWSNGGLWLDVDGVIGGVALDELSLADDESTQNRYALGDTVDDLFVWGVNHDDRTLDLSIRRNAPGYVEALNAHSVGDVVSATVTGFLSNSGLWLDVGGVIGSVQLWELSLAADESTQDRYAVGDTVDALFVWLVDHGDRDLSLSVRRNMPGYVEALNAHSVGDVVSATVTGFQSDDGLWLDVGGVIGSVSPWNFPLADDESSQDRYAVGDTIHDLFVWQVDQDDRDLFLSARRSAPTYVEALNARSVGDVVSATVTGFQGNGGLLLDVGGVIGGVPPWELSLANGESAQDRYAVGDTVDELFVWQVNLNTRDLALSIRRSMPDYVEALADISVGNHLEGIVVEANEWGVWLEIAGVIGWVSASELQLDTGEAPPERYPPGDPIMARVWQIGREARDVILSVHRLGPGFSEESIKIGATIDAIVRGSTPRGIRSPIRVLAANTGVWIPPHALSLSTTMPSRFQDGQVIPVVVTKLDELGRPVELSHRRTLDRWEPEMQRLSRGTVVPAARLLASGAISETEGRAAVDLGSITGFIPADELDSDMAQNLMTHSGNETYAVVVQSVDVERGTAIVSHEEFPARWRELAAEFQEGVHVDAELRDIDGRDALLDLGSGLLATLPVDQLPPSETPGATVADRIGENIPVRIARIVHDTQTIYAERREQWLETLIGEPESETLEFKAVLRGGGGQTARTTMTRRSIRTINAFVNTNGGRLIIGIQDETREVLGLEADQGLSEAAIAKKIDNAFRILASNLKRFTARSPLESIDDLVTWRTESVRGKTLLIVKCGRGPAHGVDLVVGDDQREFYIRDQDSTRPLSEPEDINDHLRKRADRAAPP